MMLYLIFLFTYVLTKKFRSYKLLYYTITTLQNVDSSVILYCVKGWMGRELYCLIEKL